MTAEIFILNYNGRDLLLSCLPSVLIASRQSRYPSQVTVIDNCSLDDSVEIVRKKFPDVGLIVPEKNRVLCSFNDAVQKSRADVVVLLNNDLRVDPKFLGPLIEALERHPEAFFAAPKVLGFDSGDLQGAISKMDFRWGLPSGRTIEKSASLNRASNDLAYTMQCGMGAFRRDRFIELGGYEDLYLPGTVEDTDLCFRGWRRGWQGYYCPESVIYHMGQTSFKRAFGSRGIDRLNRRNLYLFVWKNIRSPRLLAQHIFLIPFQLLKYCLFGQLCFIEGFTQAVALLPEALKRRRAQRAVEASLSDEQIFSISRGL